MSGRRSELRFERQYYQREYLEDLCERTVAEFCVDAYGQELVPLPTDALTQLIERNTSMLDLYARLDEGINGVTTMFSSNRLPCVEIAAELSRQWFRENRLRTTLAHEFGHYADFRIMPRRLREPSPVGHEQRIVSA